MRDGSRLHGGAEIRKALGSFADDSRSRAGILEFVGTVQTHAAEIVLAVAVIQNEHDQWARDADEAEWRSEHGR